MLKILWYLSAISHLSCSKDFQDRVVIPLIESDLNTSYCRRPIKAYFNCMYRSHKGIFFFFFLCVVVFIFFNFNCWVTLPCAVRFLNCAPTNGGRLKAKSVHFCVYQRVIFFYQWNFFDNVVVSLSAHFFTDLLYFSE